MTNPRLKNKIKNYYKWESEIPTYEHKSKDIVLKIEQAFGSKDWILEQTSRKSGFTADLSSESFRTKKEAIKKAKEFLRGIK